MRPEVAEAIQMVRAGLTRLEAALAIDDPPFESLNGMFPGIEVGEAQAQRWFTAWWAAYWLHKGKADAYRSFRKHCKTEARLETIMAATRAQSAEMKARAPEHRPHGATWLNAERWEDEVVAGGVGRTKQAAIADDFKRRYGIPDDEPESD